MNRCIVALILSGYVGSASAWTKNGRAYSTDGSQADVASAVANALAGDTVQVPAGTFTWGAGRSGVAVNQKITLQGAGATLTTIVLSESGPTYGTGVIQLNAAATIRDFSITGSSGTVTAFSCYGVNGWRVTNIHFDGGAGSGYFLYAGSYGLIDDCQLTGNNGSAEWIFSRGPTNSWQTPSSLGTAEAVYIEDCVFGGQGYVSDANSNARMVVRFCTMNGSNKVDAHGVASNTPPRGCRQIEVYGNSWTSTGGYFADIEIRGGTGMLFDNSDQNPQGGWFFLSDYGYLGKWPNFGSRYLTPADYPIADQIGVGQDPILAGSEPLYAWNNSRLGVPWARTVRTPDAAAITAYGKDFKETDVIAADRDYFWSVANFDGSTGIGRGTKAQMTEIVPTKVGVGYWVTDEGDWNARHPGTDGRLYAWTGSDWTARYMPYSYPHPLRLPDGNSGIDRRGRGAAFRGAVTGLDKGHLVVDLESSAEVEATLHSQSGRSMALPIHGTYQAGRTLVPLGKTIPTGLYMVRSRIGGGSPTVVHLVVE